MSDNLTIFGLNYNNIDGIKAIDTNGNEITYTRYSLPFPDVEDGSPVKFIDYDGTILYSYSVADFLALAALPALVSHTGKSSATAWNWTLADAKTYVQSCGALIIGQEYAKTELDIELIEDCSPYLGLGINGTVSVDWGDGTSENITGTSLTTQKRTMHSYSAGAYTIGITVVSGSFQFRGSAQSTVLSNNRTSTNPDVQNLFFSSSLQYVRLASGVNCASYAFNHCNSLRSITIPSGATLVGSYAFYGCYLLSYVSLPKTVTSLEGNAFQSTPICAITIPSGVTSMSGSVFNACSSLRSVIVPGGATTIPDSAFSSDTNLRTVVLSYGVEVLSNAAFRYCRSIRSITLPSTLTTIGTYAFDSSYGIRSITIPSSVTKIDNYAFQNCYSLNSITVLASSPPTLGTSVFNTTPSTLFTIWVPHGSLSAYQTASNWSAFASRMKELPA